MAQGGGGKRKRGDRTYSQDNVNDSSRPSPHRPDALRLAQQNHNSPQHGHGRESPVRGGRRSSRGGRPLNSPSGPHYQQRPPSSASNSMPSPGLVRTDPPTETETKPTPAKESTSTQTTSDVDGAPYYFYEDFADDVVKSWDQSRKQSIVQAARAAKESAQLPTLRRIYQETLRSGLDGRIPVLDAADIINNIVTDINTQSAQSVLDKKAAEDFLDVVAIAHQLEGYHPDLQTILVNCGIPLELIRTNLDDTLLEQVRLVQKTFGRSGVRYATNVLYRMKIYNLIREETEGYSKLITELFTTSGNESPSPEAISALLTRVNAMVGTFNLDVGRVFDITLDVFAAVLVKHYRFFIKYLRASFWWPEARVSEDQSDSVIGLQPLPRWALPDVHGSQSLSEDERREIMSERLERDVKFWDRVREVGLKAYFELGNRRATPESLDNVVIMNKEVLEFHRDWVGQTGTVPPPGNKIAAQILGLKLRFYESPCRDDEDTMPSNLIYLTALLIKVGFISFFDLYPHLWPSDDQMASVEEQKRKEKKERDVARKPGGGSNALTRAAALPDDTLPVQSRKAPETTTAASVGKPEAKETKSNQESASTGEKRNDLPEPVDQKIQLLRSLLCIGALPEALYMMGRFKWLPELVPDIPEHINRILHHSLSRVYEPLRPLKNLDAVREPGQVTDLDQASTQKGDLKLVDQPPRKTLRWAQIDKTDSSEGIDYRFYWEDWTDNIPMCNNVDDVFLLCKHLLNFSGLQIGRDPFLLAKLARIGVHSLDSDTSESNFGRWFDLCKRLLVPALTFSDCNSGIVSEVWTLLKRFTTTKRYNIYAEWYHGQTSRNDDVKVAFDATAIKTKAVLKRISRDNTKTMARAFAKIAVCAPGKVFEVMLNQVESYNNLINVVTEISRYFTDLAYDVLTWSLVNALGKSRSRVQEDGMLTSKWLSALGAFSGSVFKRYGVMNPTPVLQYVAHQLQKGNSTDLVVLDSIVYSMAGIVSDATLGENNVIAMTGGPFLRSQVLQTLEDQRHKPLLKSSSRRLMRALINPKLAGLLLVSICQRRQACLFSYPDDNAPLKLLGNLFDEIHRVLTQYIDLLHTNLSHKDFSALIPSISDMIAKFGIDPNVAFWIWRPFLATEIAQHDKGIASEKAIASQKVIVENANDSAETQSRSPEQDVSLTNSEKNNEGASIEEPKTTEVLDKSTDPNLKDQVQRDLHQPDSTEQKSVCHPIIQRVIESVRPVLPAATFDTLSESFYFTFWRLSPYDMHVPDAYQDECRKLTLNIEQSKSDRTKEPDRRSWTASHTSLSMEYKDHLTAHLKTKVALQKEKDLWFDQCTKTAEDLSMALLEHCFLPRMLISSMDAFFVFKMFKFLHTQGAKNFKTIMVLDCLFIAKRLTPLFFMCTAKEAEHIGRFFSEVLKDLAKWHASAEVFEKEAHGPKKDFSSFHSKPDTPLNYEGFRSLLCKWHQQLHDAFKACFLSGEYMHIRNAIIILKAVSLHFPTVKHMGDSLVNCITELSASETRSDLKLAALSLLGNIRSRDKQWVIRQEFSLNKPSATSNGNSTPKVDSAKSRTPQPENNSTTKGLNAKAPEFIPSSSSIKTPNKIAGSKGDGEEDGEIKDAASGKPPITTSTVVDAAKPAERAVAGKKVEANFAPASMQGGAKESLPPKKPSPQPKHSEPPAKSVQKPADLPAIPPKPRPENHRNQSDPAAAGRPSHGLPSRPETTTHGSRTTGQRSSDRLNDRVSRDPGHLRETVPRRNERTSENAREQQQERHEASRAFDRQEKLYQDEREREVAWGGDQVPPNRPHSDRHTQHPPDARPLLREERSDRSIQDRHYTQSRDHRNEGDLQAPRSKDTSMAPPRSSAVQHQDRPLAAQYSQDFDRTYQTGHPDRRPEGVRSDIHGHTSSQRGSRTSSPSRRDEQPSHVDYHRHRDDRGPPDNRRYGDASAPPRHDASRLPTGPRTERQTEVNHPGHAERLRDNVRSSSYASTSEGRLVQDYSRPRQQESQYGRLNQDPPAGPRMPNGTHGQPSRGNRNASAPQPQIEARPPQQPSQSATSGAPDKMTPTGPASGRAPSRHQPQSNRPPPITTSIPSASVSESPDTAGVHPDRLKAIQSSGLENPGFGRKPPTPVEVPAGPRNTQTSQPQDSHPPSRPSGPPANAAERGRGDKRFAGINTLLSQTNSPTGPDRGNQGTSIRGRHARSNVSSSPVTNAPPRRDLPAPIEAGPAPRQDLFANRQPSGNMGSARDYDGSYDRGGPRPSDRKAPPRQRDAQSMSPRRDVPPSRQRDDMRQPRMDEPRDYRGRGNGPMPPVPPMIERDRRVGPPPRDNVGPFGPKDRREHDRRDEWAGDNRMGPDRRDNRPERRVSGMEDGGSGRKRGRGPEEVYEQGRPMQHDYPKRTRRGG